MPNNHGGLRKCAGRRTKFLQASVVMRVPKALAPAVRSSLDAYRDRLELKDLGLKTVAIDPAPLLIQSVLTKVAAGFPSPADDYLDDGIDLNRMLVRNGPATYIYMVEDGSDSMVGKGISGGDRLLVDRSIEPRNRHIVLALIPGEGLTVKELQIRGATMRLVPHSPNPIHKARTLKDGDDIQIIGVVTTGITQFPT